MSISSACLYESATIVTSDLFNDVEALKEQSDYFINFLLNYYSRAPRRYIKNRMENIVYY